MRQKQEETRDAHKQVALIVDDHAAIRSLVASALSLDGIESVEAGDGQVALQWLYQASREGVVPVMILLDLAMPGMDGMTFLQQFLTLWHEPLPPIIVITAHLGSVDATTLGVAQVIKKPSLKL
jgi:two-component system chemotaxis response regulator CheB